MVLGGRYLLDTAADYQIHHRRIVTTKLFGAPLNRISTQHLLGCCESQDENGGVSIMGIGLLVGKTWPVETEETGFYYRPLYDTKINDELSLWSCAGPYYLTRISRDSVFFFPFRSFEPPRSLYRCHECPKDIVVASTRAGSFSPPLGSLYIHSGNLT